MLAVFVVIVLCVCVDGGMVVFGDVVWVELGV